jgi:4-hydroxy-tetrahydrodipicolinate synthase
MKQGSTVALVTPFFPETGKINYAELERLLQFHVKEGTDNLCILGTTGEASVMTMEEREKVLKLTVEQVKGKMPIMVGTGTIDPARVKAMTQQAIDLGCDAGLVVTPFYVKPPQRGLIKHFTDAADLGLPVVLYNVPGRTCANLLDSSIATLAQHEYIVGLKDATGDVGRLDSLKKEMSAQGFDGDFLCYSGDDGTTVDFVLKGGDGCISVTANCAPKMMHDMVAAGLKGDEKEARRLHEVTRLLHENLFCEANPIPVKWAVSRMGMISSPYCRPPLDALDPALEDKVEMSLKAAGLI